MARKKEAEKSRTCGECSHATPFTDDFRTLSVQGEPTLATCPFMRRKVLLSEKSCLRFKHR